MSRLPDPARRSLLARVAAGLMLAPLVRAGAAESQTDPPLREDDAAAKAVHYVEDVRRAKDAKPGANCSNCGLYNGAEGAPAGACATLFPGKSVKAAGWCDAWADL